MYSLLPEKKVGIGTLDLSCSVVRGHGSKHAQDEGEWSALHFDRLNPRRNDSPVLVGQENG